MVNAIKNNSSEGDSPLLGHESSALLPRFIRVKFAPKYLGMDKNRFNDEVRPYLTEIPIGVQGIAFDRLELDAWAVQYKARYGRPARTRGKLWDADTCRASETEAESGILKSKSRGTGLLCESCKASDLAEAEAYAMQHIARGRRQVMFGNGRRFCFGRRKESGVRSGTLRRELVGGAAGAHAMRPQWRHKRMNPPWPWLDTVPLIDAGLERPEAGISVVLGRADSVLSAFAGRTPAKIRRRHYRDVRWEL